MRSSISNSDIHLTRRYVPAGRWLGPFFVALIVALLAILALEWRLASRGFQATVIDSPALWAEQRARVDHLGERALILVGASHMQLDVDLETLRRMTGKEPVQLAIDGKSFVLVLDELANDDAATGTILVDYQDPAVGDLGRSTEPSLYLEQWRRERDHRRVVDFATSEAWLASFVHRHMRSFADGASPFDSLILRALQAKATPQYLVTLPDRERLADYSKVHMPDFYLDRAQRNAGLSISSAPIDPVEREAQLARRIGALPEVPMPDFGANSQVIAGMVRRIQARGGQVAFVMFPRSGLVREADDHSFPRSRYWDPFIAKVGAPSLHYADVPSMRALVCPDGAHLDRRERVAFTRDLVHAMPLLSGGNADIVPRTARSASTPNFPEQVP